MRFRCSECLEYIYYKCIGIILFYVVAICHLAKAFIELNCCCCFGGEELPTASLGSQSKIIKKAKDGGLVEKLLDEENQDIESNDPVEEHKSHEVTDPLVLGHDIENQMKVAGDLVNSDGYGLTTV